jgi:ribosomal protein S18 acetylase RimI-like enzyme
VDEAEPIVISSERPDTADAVALVEELEAHLASRYPAASRHGFSVERLVAEGVEFFVLRTGGVPAACGGILFVDGDGGRYGEVKRMWVRPPFRGRGFGRRVLDHLADHARASGVTILRLETGIHQVEAIGLYERAGFYAIAPFGPYTDDPLTRCFERRLDRPLANGGRQVHARGLSRWRWVDDGHGEVGG